MTPQHHLPADIERTSISIITRELDELGLTPPPETAAVVKRVIHTTADFDYAKNLRFTPGAVQAAVRALQRGAVIVTDTNMALAGISRPGLAKLGCEAVCYMADPAFVAPQLPTRAFWDATFAVQSSGTFLETVKVNLWEGQLAICGHEGNVAVVPSACSDVAGQQPATVGAP